MKKQNKVIAAVLGVLVVGGIALASTSPNLFQGKISPSANNLTRGEFIKMVVVEAGLELEPCEIYPDVPLGSPYNEYVCTLANKSIVFGFSDGTFQTGSSINRAEAAKILYKAFDVDYTCPLPTLFPDISENDWHYQYVNKLGAFGLFSIETKIGSNFKPYEVLKKSSAQRWFSQIDKLK